MFFCRFHMKFHDFDVFVFHMRHIMVTCHVRFVLLKFRENLTSIQHIAIMYYMFDFCKYFFFFAYFIVVLCSVVVYCIIWYIFFLENAGKQMLICIFYKLKCFLNFLTGKSFWEPFFFVYFEMANHRVLSKPNRTDPNSAKSD